MVDDNYVPRLEAQKRYLIDRLARAESRLTFWANCSRFKALQYALFGSVTGMTESFYDHREKIRKQLEEV